MINNRTQPTMLMDAPSSLPSLLGLASFSSRLEDLSSSWIADIRDGAKLLARPAVLMDLVLQLNEITFSGEKGHSPFLPESKFEHFDTSQQVHFEIFR